MLQGECDWQARIQVCFQGPSLCGLMPNNPLNQLSYLHRYVEVARL